MAWQQELRVLDAAVAQGTISTAEYRERRDELLVLAADNAVDAGSDHTGSDHTGSDRTGSNHTGSDHTGSGRSAPGPPPLPARDASAPDPFPPPFRWSPERPPAGGHPPEVPDERARRRTGPGLPPWVTAAGLAERPQAPDAGDAFDDSPPPPYRLVTAIVLAVALVVLAVWLALR